MHYRSLSNHLLTPDNLETVIKAKYSFDALQDGAQIVSQIQQLKPHIKPSADMFNLYWLCSIVLRIGYEMGRKDRRTK